MVHRVGILIGVVFLLLLNNAQSQIPKTLSYQGILTDNTGAPRPDGSYSLTFKLFDVSGGGTSIWNEAQSLQVTNGLFSAMLGNIVPVNLPFDKQYWLEVTVGNDPPLTPRIKMTSVGYSYTADSSAVAGSITAGKAVTSINGLTDAVNLLAGSNVTITPGSGSITIGATGGGGGGLTLPYSDTVNTAITIPALRIVNTGAGRVGEFRINSGNNNIAVFGQTNGTGNAGRFENIGTTNTGVLPTLVGINHAQDGEGVYGSIVTGNGHGVRGAASGPATSSGVFGEHFGAGVAVRGITTGTGPAGKLEINNPTNNNYGLHVTTTGIGTAGRFETFGSASTSPAVLGYNNGQGAGVHGSVIGNGHAVSGAAIGNGSAIYGQHSGNGSAVRGLSTGIGQGAWFEKNNSSSISSVVHVVGNHSGSGISMIHSGTGAAGLFSISNASSNAPAIIASTNGTGPAGRFNGKVEVDVLQINGGSDLAEPFDHAGNTEVEPGTIMVIDQRASGKLTISSRAYDPKVAGIVSGAGGIKPGLTLAQQTLLEGNTLVALAGRVYCKAEAESAVIRPGDLLTTSDIPGHAMRATDRNRAHGTIIGKAMSGLTDGTGLVLVLVNLQ